MSCSLHYILLALWRGRAVQPTSGRRCALFERSEFARRRNRRTAQGTRRVTPRPTWFWVLLPKQKGLVRRDETRQHKNPIQRCSFANYSTNDSLMRKTKMDSRLKMSGMTEERRRNYPFYHSSICPTSLRLYPPRASTSRRNG